MAPGTDVKEVTITGKVVSRKAIDTPEGTAMGMEALSLHLDECTFEKK
jgi:hypothetical protein